MQPHSLVAIVTLVALLMYLAFSFNVGRMHHKTGILAPQMTGDPRLERASRVQMNTLEWLPLFLVSLWLFAHFWNDLVAAILGGVWIAGRLLYAAAYMADPPKRGAGFLIQAAATMVLLLGALGRAVFVYLTLGA